jgi:uncharacterized membrane protein YccC
MTTPPLPTPARRGLRAMLEVRAAPRRWPRALRAAVCMGVPILAGWLAGDLAAGLTATLGGFTALYGSGRPYANRAVLLAVVAASLSAAVGLGMWTAAITWLGILTVAAIATAATLLCNALEVGPPGAYQFALVCALLVLSGGCLAWIVHMAGALIAPRGPEKSAVAEGGLAVAQFVDAIGTDAEGAARHRAAQAMHDAWKHLVSFQPRRASTSLTVRRLQEVTRRLHLVFADAMAAASTGRPVDPEASASARACADRALLGSGVPVEATTGGSIPLGRPGAKDLITAALQRHSRSRLIVFRVGVATVVAGGLAGSMGLAHAYWAMSAAVLILHQGLDRRRTTQRALERLIGTWVGLLLAATVIAAEPHALWLVAVVMVLNFGVEYTVVRNYTLAVVFITAVALVISTSAHGTDDLGDLLLARGVDTAVGCAVALAVFRLLVPAGAATWLSTAIADTLDAVGATTSHLQPSAIGTPAAKAARRDLQRCLLRLTQTFDVDINGSARQRRAAERAWPTIAATQRLAYRTIAECWRLERLSQQDQTARAIGDLGPLRAALSRTSTAVRSGTEPGRVTVPPGTLSAEMRGLLDTLHRGTA